MYRQSISSTPVFFYLSPMKIQNLVVIAILPLVLASCFGKSTSSEQTKVEAPKAVNVVGIITSGDVDRCTELIDADKIANCRNNVYLEKAMTENNPVMCDSITNTGALERCQIQTYLNLALTSNNPELCAKIPGKKEYADNCKNQITLNAAYASKNGVLCDTIIGDEAKVLCRDNIKLQIATASTDGKLCKEIKTEALKTQCEGITAPKVAEIPKN